MRVPMIDLRKIAAMALSTILVAPLVAASVAEASSTTKRKKVRVYKQAPAPTAYRWRPADPSFDQYGRPYQPPPGTPCPIDLGYGRWSSCMER